MGSRVADFRNAGTMLRDVIPGKPTEFEEESDAEVDSDVEVELKCGEDTQERGTGRREWGVT